MAKKIKEEIEKAFLANTIDSEYKTSVSNKSDDIDDFESYIDMFNAERTDREYDWMSDISIPEFASHMLTQGSIDANQMFQTRDFTEVYLEDEGEEALANAEAAKELINRTLNQRHLHHFLKYMRAKTLNHVSGEVYAVCGWEQVTKEAVVDIEDVEVELDIDDFGDKIVSEDQVPAIGMESQPVMDEVAVIDRFNYEIVDNRNVFTDNKYAYSLQEKDYIFIRSEKTLHDLKEDAETKDYFGLDDIEEDVKPPKETDTSKNSYNKGINSQDKPDRPVSPYYDVIDRYGRAWCKIIERDEEDNPIEVEPGVDEEGKPLKDAELLEVISTVIMSDNFRKLIRFMVTPFIDADGIPYKPLLRGLCYVHPTKDSGAGDGKYAKELQIAIDDSFNLGMDRVRLATIPVLKGSKYSLEDNSTVYIEPGHTIELENKDDLDELKISDNIAGTMATMQMLTGKMQQTDSITQPALGQTGLASTTATAVADASQQTNIRTNYKSLTFEHTFLTDLYWMIQQMTYSFAKQETGAKLMGDKVFDFDPSKDYYYKPVSQAIESEQAKGSKIDKINFLISQVANMQHPNAVVLVNGLISKIFGLMGDEFADFGKLLLDEGTPIQGGPGSTAVPGEPTSNQTGLPQSTAEQAVREQT